ncbi:hypothetical protein PybrP1_009025 [[Pythium] brassicae (nom. inval.)]|nr:hypothetical protein PybrP1_009025 [[Pythium] brassicae (nom. inval.)]
MRLRTSKAVARLLGLLAALLLLSLSGSGGPVAGDAAATETHQQHHQQEESDEQPALRTQPVLLIPGFASSQLHSWKHVSCEHGIQKNLYRDVNIGDRLWIDIARILAQSDCWVRCMKLHAANQSEIACKLRAADGMAAISELDPGLLTGPLSMVWGSLIRDLVDTFGLGPNELVIAPYDWRLPPSKLQERDRYFTSLKRKIEQAVELHGGSGGMVVVAHSMGNGVFRYFLAWLKLELGRNNWQPWIDKHVAAYFAVGSPLLGSSEALELLSSGLTQGLPVSQREIRKLVATFGAIISFLPVPSTLNSSHDSETLIHVRFEGDKREQSYSSAEIASGQFFRDLAERDPIFAELEQVRKRFYEDDDVLDFLAPWERPPIAAVYSVYGVNLPTKHNYKYQDTDTDGHWYQVAFENELSSRHACGKTGDGTVPYHSLSWAHTWLGRDSGAVVDVTQVPQSVYFSDDSIQAFQATRGAAADADSHRPHHAEYTLHSHRRPMCSPAESVGGSAATNTVALAASGFLDGFFKASTLDQITFFEHDQVLATGATHTTGVWEIDGAGHREILGNPAFLRELRAELRNLFAGKTRSDKTSRPPMVDSDCYWNYRRAKCEFPDYCEYRYSFGDVILDQSCRVRQRRLRPAAPLRPPLVDASADASVAATVSSQHRREAATAPPLDFSRPFCSTPCHQPTSDAGQACPAA